MVQVEIFEVVRSKILSKTEDIPIQIYILQLPKDLEEQASPLAMNKALANG
jgi:hypothetical protein